MSRGSIPSTHEVGLIKTEWRDAKTPTTKTAPIYAPSPYWGTEPVWDSHSINHNPMMDEKGRVWLTSRIRPDANPAFCKTGSKHPSAAFPVDTSRRQLQMYDPATKKIDTIDTCYTTHHLNFDDDGVLWFSSGRPNDQRHRLVRYEEMGRRRMTNRRAKAGRLTSST